MDGWMEREEVHTEISVRCLGGRVGGKEERGRWVGGWVGELWLIVSISGGYDPLEGD